MVMNDYYPISKLKYFINAYFPDRKCYEDVYYAYNVLRVVGLQQSIIPVVDALYKQFYIVPSAVSVETTGNAFLRHMEPMFRANYYFKNNWCLDIEEIKAEIDVGVKYLLVDKKNKHVLFHNPDDVDVGVDHTLVNIVYRKFGVVPHSCTRYFVKYNMWRVLSNNRIGEVVD